MEIWEYIEPNVFFKYLVIFYCMHNECIHVIRIPDYLWYVVSNGFVNVYANEVFVPRKYCIWYIGWNTWRFADDNNCNEIVKYSIYSYDMYNTYTKEVFV